MRPALVLRLFLYLAAVAGLSLLGASLRGAAPMTPVWPVCAVILAAALRGASSVKGRAVIVGLGCLTAYLVMLALGRPAGISLGYALCNVLEISIGLAALWRFKPPVLGARGFTRLVLGASLAGPVAAAMLAAVLHAVTKGEAEAAALGLRWVATHGLGMMAIAPALLSLQPRSVRPEHMLKLGAVLTTAVMINVLALTAPAPALLILLGPCLALAVGAGGEVGAALVLALASLTAASLTALGFGPAAGSMDLYLYEVFRACLAIGAHALLAVARLLDGYAAEIGDARDPTLREPAE